MKKNSKSFLLSLVYIILALAVCVAVFALTYNGGGAYMLRQGEADASPVSPIGENIPDTPATPKVEASPTKKPSTSGRLFPFTENGMWGYKNSKGEVVIEPTLSDAYEFDESIAFAAINGRFGIISRNGIWLVEPQWEDVLPFSENKAAVKSGSKWGFINTEYELIIDYLFDEAGSFSCGRALVYDSSLGDGYGYIDINGTLAATAKWRRANTFYEDKAFVKSGSTSYIINKIGETVATLESDESGTGYCEGFALIKADDEYFFMNSRYRQAFSGNYKGALPFSSSYAAIQNDDGLWGYINTSGEIKIEPAFYNAKSFSTTDKLAAVYDNELGLWGYINKSGKLVIPFSFDEADTFLNGYAVVKKGEAHYILDTDGNTVFLY